MGVHVAGGVPLHRVLQAVVLGHHGHPALCQKCLLLHGLPHPPMAHGCWEQVRSWPPLHPRTSL